MVYSAAVREPLHALGGFRTARIISVYRSLLGSMALQTHQDLELNSKASKHMLRIGQFGCVQSIILPTPPLV